VTLAASGLPSGVTAAFATNPTTGTSVLTLTVSSTATFAAATVTITGTSGALTATTTVNLVVDGCETTGLSLTSSPTALSVTQGGTATDTITVIEYCFNGSTTLSAAGLPAGVTATFTPNPTTSQTSLLKLTATSTAAAGTSFLTIIGASGSIVANTTISLTVIAKPAPGFTLAASPSTLAISQGKSATGTITVTDVDGFTGSVTLAASGLPSGVTAAFATNPAKATSVLTLTASSTATVGVSTVTVTGTSGTLKATTSIALTVNPSVGFTLAPSASTLTIVQGSSGADTINVTDFGGFTGRVTLAATGLPGGVTATFNANPATGTSVLTLKTSSTATDGTSTVTVTGTSGSHTATAAITLTVSTPAGPFSISPSAPTLSIVQGGSGTETIALVGFAGSVELYMSNPGLPAGVTYAFAPNPTTTGSSVLTLTASATAAPGTYAITIEGIDGSLSEALTSFTLNVTAAPSGTACHIGYSITGQWAGGFEVALTINNTGTTALSSWVLTWTIPNGQTITQLWNGVETQNGANITVKNESYNDSIPAGGSYAGVGFDGTSNNLTNAAPTSFALNGTVCTVN